METEQIVTGTEVHSNKPIDYGKLIKDFGSQPVDDEIIDLINQVIIRRGLVDKKDKYLYYFKRGIFFSHRNLKSLLVNYLACMTNDKSSAQTFYIYTGRGPSSESLHIGHLIPFRMTQLLQELFDVPVVIQLTDDEKYYYSKDKKTLADFRAMAAENIKDILACGFNPQKTFTFTNTEYIQNLYPIVVQIQKLVNLNTVQAMFGFDNQSSVGKVSFPAIQAAPAFSACFPNFLPQTGKPLQCLVPCAIDQDVYFRLTSDVAHRLGHPKPVLLHAQFLPSLMGLNMKMSSSIADSVIFLSETEKSIAKKIGKCFSGGGDTIELHKANGANLDVDVPIHYLRFFLEDEAQYMRIRADYGKGIMSTGEVKKILIDVIKGVINQHKALRSP